MPAVENDVLHYRGFLNSDNDDIYSIVLDPESNPPVVNVRIGHILIALKVDSEKKYKILDTMVDELKFVLKCAVEKLDPDYC